MMATDTSDQGEGLDAWDQSGSQQRLYRRFGFPDYAKTREFLDAMAEVSEELGLYPDLSFGRTYVNVTIVPRDGETLGSTERELASRIDTLASRTHEQTDGP